MNYNTSVEYNNYDYEDSSGTYEINDYIWVIIVVSAIIILTIIGFFADKYNLVKRNNRKKNNEKVKDMDDNQVATLNNLIEDSKQNVEKKDLEIKKDDYKEVSDAPVSNESLEEQRNPKIDGENKVDEVTNALKSETDNITEANKGKKAKTNDTNNLIDNQNLENVEEKNKQEELSDKNVKLDNKEEFKNEKSKKIDESTFTEEISDQVDENINKMYELSDEDDIVDMELPDLDSIDVDNSSDDFWKF